MRLLLFDIYGSNRRQGNERGFYCGGSGRLTSANRPTFDKCLFVPMKNNTLPDEVERLLLKMTSCFVFLPCYIC
ncbi:hypothetical protein XENOCAPTIV_023446 [Xenoophorus captivus]|uniref:Uncharacterized protein n=1 Tax=Xenoophorus captivus TaxID=1517983 RepID=A0ABV0R5T9_9TELE